MNLTTRDLAKIFNISNQRINKIVKDLEIKEPEVIFRGKTRHYKPSATRKILNHRNFKMKRQIISIQNLKGGVGKSTIAVNLAKFISSLGITVCLIDADKQANATGQFYEGRVQKTLFDIVRQECSIQDTLIKISDSLTLLPSSLVNSRLDNEFANMNINPRRYLNELLSDINFEFIIIDTEPSLSKINFLSMIGSDLTIIPILLDRFSLEGLGMVLDAIEDAESNWDNLKINKKILINKYDDRVKSSLDYFSQLNDFKVELFQTVIKTDATFLKTQAPASDIIKSSNAFKNISSLALELLAPGQTFSQLQ